MGESTSSVSVKHSRKNCTHLLCSNAIVLAVVCSRCSSTSYDCVNEALTHEKGVSVLDFPRHQMPSHVARIRMS